MSFKSFAGARVIVTGGASGIGLALARRMIKQGAQVAFCDKNSDAVEAAKIGLPGSFGEVCDVTDDKALSAFIDQSIDHLGGMDVGWNNAGVMQKSAPIQSLDWAEYQRVLNVNLHAVFRGSQIMARHMIAQGTPALIINTGSENSLFHTVPGGGAYVASKMAVRALTESLYEDTPEFIDVKLLCPGFVNTSLGSKAMFKHGMDVEQFSDIAFPLLTSDQFYLVTHGFNAVRLEASTGHILTDIEAGAMSAADTAMFDTYRLMGRSFERQVKHS